MSDLARDAKNTAQKNAMQTREHEDHLEDEEKILAGRHDVNYPALLTKDVPGG
jgi:hypothetical protein